jgi:hypothetical protein
VFAITAGRTRQCNTPIAPVGLHHIAGPLFTGYDVTEKGPVLIASPEKAMLDVFYMQDGERM